MLRAIVSADGEPINELHMQSKEKKKKPGEFARTFFFWLLESETLSGYLKAHFPGRLTFNSCK